MIAKFSLMAVGVYAVVNTNTYDFKTTLPILGDEYHTSCQVHSGYNLTLVHCSDQFEVYDTQKLEEQQSLLTNYGEDRRIRGVNNSLKKNDR